MNNTKPGESAPESPLKAALFILIAVTFMYFPLSIYFDLPLPFGDNVLEKALRPGSSSKDQFAAFMDKGGLQSESSWKGYGVKSVNTRYHENGKLEIAEITLGKQMLSRDPATLENLKVSLAPVCGSKWQASTEGNLSMLKTERKGVECTLQYQGDETEVVLAKRTL